MAAEIRSPAGEHVKKRLTLTLTRENFSSDGTVGTAISSAAFPHIG